jgi:hypothetical protein
LRESSPAPSRVSVECLSEDEQEASQMDVDEDRPQGSRAREKMPEEMVLLRKRRVRSTSLILEYPSNSWAAEITATRVKV